MAIATQLILISKQLIPNLIPLLDPQFKPQRVVMLVSDDMQHRAKAMIEILKPRSIGYELHRVPNPLDLAAISEQVLQIAAGYAAGELVLNATGGTKIMSIAAYEVFKTLNYPAFYVQDRLFWLHPAQPPEQPAYTLRLKDYLYAYGAQQVTVQSAPPLTPAIKTLTATLISTMEQYGRPLSTLNYLAAKADCPQLQATLPAKQPPGLSKLLQLFTDAGLCRIQGDNLWFPNEQARFQTNGGWLEQHVLGICRSLKNSGLIQEAAANILLERQLSGSAPVVNELDIALMAHNRLHLIECKTKKDEQQTDVLYKLDSLRELIGGLQGRAMLISFAPLKPASLARAKELNIAVCCHTQLKNLDNYLRQWLNYNR